MADPVAIAKMRESALARITATSRKIAEVLHIEPPTLRDYARDKSYLEAERLTALADWLDSVAVVVNQEPEVSNQAAALTAIEDAPAPAAGKTKREPHAET